jgi:hypothetical protein
MLKSRIIPLKEVESCDQLLKHGNLQGMQGKTTEGEVLSGIETY